MVGRQACKPLVWIGPGKAQGPGTHEGGRGAWRAQGFTRTGVPGLTMRASLSASNWSDGSIRESR